MVIHIVRTKVAVATVGVHFNQIVVYYCTYNC